MKKSKKEKKRLFLISFAIIMVITFLVASVYNDWQQILINNGKVVSLKSDYEELLNEEKALKSEVTKLKDPDYIARYAKEKYLYSSTGETIIRGE